MEHHNWHYATFRGEELLVLGHNPSRNDCLLVKLSGLPMNESGALRRIAQSRSGQEEPHLTNLLKRMESPDGTTNWFHYLAKKMEQRNSPVFFLPLKEIQDSLDADQKAIFKGYGKGRINRNQEINDMARTWGGEDIDADAEQEVNTKTASSPVPAKDTGDLGYKMDMVLETLVDESRKTQQLLGKLIGVLTGDPVAEPEKTTPKARKPRAAARKKTGGLEANAS